MGKTYKISWKIEVNSFEIFSLRKVIYTNTVNFFHF